jgi:hypothetical protein
MIRRWKSDRRYGRSAFGSASRDLDLILVHRLDRLDAAHDALGARGGVLAPMQVERVDDVLGLERLAVVESKTRPERTRHPTLWTVEAVRWELREHETEYDRLLAKQGEQGPGVQLGQQIGAIAVTDRAFAIAVAHHFLDRYAEEAAGRMSLEIHVHPPEQDVEDEDAYKVTDEVLEQARKLGVEGDVEQQIKRMARNGTPYYTHRKANRRHGRFALKVEGNHVVRIGLADPPRGVRKTK